MIKQKISSDFIRFYSFLYILIIAGFGLYAIYANRELFVRDWGYIKSNFGFIRSDSYDICFLIDCMYACGLLDGFAWGKVRYYLERVQKGTESWANFDQNIVRMVFLNLRYMNRKGTEVVGKLLDVFMMSKMSLKGLACIMLNDYCIQSLGGSYGREIYSVFKQNRFIVRSRIKNFDYFNITSLGDLNRISNL